MAISYIEKGEAFNPWDLLKRIAIKSFGREHAVKNANMQNYERYPAYSNYWTSRKQDVKVEDMIWYFSEVIKYDGLPDCDQQCNTSKSQYMNMINKGNHVNLLLRTFGRM